MSVLILMSTYNGEKYIKNQLDSLLSQNCPQLKILIRDDGSTDNTCSILEYYSNKFMNITWYKGIKQIQKTTTMHFLIKMMFGFLKKLVEQSIF